MSGSALAFPTPASLGSLDHYIQAVNRFPLLTAEQETALGRRWREHEDVDAARQLVLSHLRLVVAVSPQLSGLRAAAGRPDPGRQHRPDEGRAPVRPRARRPAGFVRPALDQGRDPRTRAAQLAAGEDRDDEGAAQAVLQPAQHEALVGGADAEGSERDRGRARRQAGGSARDGDAPFGRRYRARPDAGRRGSSVTPIAYLADSDDEPAQILERSETAANRSKGCARRWPSSTTAAAGSSKRAGCAKTTTRRRCSNWPTSTACPPSGSARSKARR